MTLADSALRWLRGRSSDFAFGIAVTLVDGATFRDRGGGYRVRGRTSAALELSGELGCLKGYSRASGQEEISGA